MSAEEISTGAGIVLSLALSYIPGLNVKFASLKPEIKRLIMLALLFLVSGSAYALGCAGALDALVGITLTCDMHGLLGLGRSLILAIIANQAIYQISPLPEKVRTAANLARFK